MLVKNIGNVPVSVVMVRRGFTLTSLQTEASEESLRGGEGDKDASGGLEEEGSVRCGEEPYSLPPETAVVIPVSFCPSSEGLHEARYDLVVLPEAAASALGVGDAAALQSASTGRLGAAENAGSLEDRTRLLDHGAAALHTVVTGKGGVPRLELNLRGGILDFGTVWEGRKMVRQVLIRNVGTYPGEFSLTHVHGTDLTPSSSEEVRLSAFRLDKYVGRIEPGAEDGVAVAFTPDHAHPYSATLKAVLWNEVHLVSVSGKGGRPIVALGVPSVPPPPAELSSAAGSAAGREYGSERERSRPNLMGSPIAWAVAGEFSPLLTMGAAVFGSRATRPLRVRNTGDVAFPFVLSGVLPPFGVVGGASTVVVCPVGATVEVEISFSPTEEHGPGAHESHVMVEEASGHEGPARLALPLRLMGVAGTFQLDVSGSLGFGEVAQRASSTAVVTVGNVGTIATRLSYAFEPPELEALLDVSLSTDDLFPGTVAHLTVTLVPDARNPPPEAALLLIPSFDERRIMSVPVSAARFDLALYFDGADEDEEKRILEASGAAAGGMGDAGSLHAPSAYPSSKSGMVQFASSSSSSSSSSHQAASGPGSAAGSASTSRAPSRPESSAHGELPSAKGGFASAPGAGPGPSRPPRSNTDFGRVRAGTTK